MNHATRLATVAALTALAITTAMDATGYTMFSALPLIVLIPLFAYLGMLDRPATGFVTGPAEHYAGALLIPALALGLLTGLALIAGATSEVAWQPSVNNIALMFSTGIIMVAITEEGFFRGVLWGLLAKAGLGSMRILLLTTAIFVAWHFSAVLLATEFAPAPQQLPLYLVNATLLGLIWGLMRQLSGSIWPGSVYHSLWNALAYELYGFGTHAGALGIEASWLYGPELGIAGIVINGGVAAWYWHRWRSNASDARTRVEFA